MRCQTFWKPAAFERPQRNSANIPEGAVSFSQKHIICRDRPLFRSMTDAPRKDKNYHTLIGQSSHLINTHAHNSLHYWNIFNALID